MSSTAIEFEDHWSPLFTLRHLGYRMRIDSVAALSESVYHQDVYAVEKGTPFGNWLMPPGPNILSAQLAPKEEQTIDGTSE
jgi:hypothetical protein